MACNVSRFSRYQKIPVPQDMHEKDKEMLGYYRSINWTSPAHFIPNYPDWNQVRHVSFINNDIDHIDRLIHGNTWTDSHRQKHQVKASISHPIGTLPSDIPELKRQGHQRCLQEDPPSSMFTNPYFPWPKRDANIPSARLPRGEYYNYYHNAFHSVDRIRHCLRPFPQRIQPNDIPRVTELRCKGHHQDLNTTTGPGLSSFNIYP